MVVQLWNTWLVHCSPCGRFFFCGTSMISSYSSLQWTEWDKQNASTIWTLHQLVGQVERNCRWLPSVTCAQRPRLSGGEVAQDIKTLSPHHHPSHHPPHHSHHHYLLLCLSCLFKSLCFLRRHSLSLLDNHCTMLGNSARHRSLFAGNQRKACGCECSRSISIAQLRSQKVLRVCATFTPSILLLM